MNFEQILLAQAGVPVESFTINLGGVGIHYIRAGSGPALLLIHGLNMGLGQWYKNIAALAEHYTVYALDLPSAGLSSSVDFLTFDIKKYFVDITSAFIKQVIGSPACIVAHSLGGWIAVQVTLQYPDLINKIVLVNPFGFTSYVGWKFRPVAFGFFAKFLAATAMKPSFKAFKTFFKTVVVRPDSIADDFVSYFYTAIKRSPATHPFYLIHRLINATRIKEQFVITGRMTAITKPWHIIMGDSDPLIPLKELRGNLQSVAGSSISVIAHTGHVPPLENHIIFNNLVVKFLLHGIM